MLVIRGMFLVLGTALIVRCAPAEPRPRFDVRKRSYEIRTSLLYEQSGILLRQSVAPGRLLSSSDRKRLEQQLSDLTSELLRLNVTSTSALEGSLHVGALEHPRITVRVTSMGKPVSNVQSDGLVTIDTQVLFAALRSSTIAGYHQKGLTSEMDRNAAYQTFQDVRRRIASATRPHRHRSRHGSVHYFYPSRVNVDSATFSYWRSVSNHYFGTLLFILAHEIGHQALNHTSDSRLDSCVRFQNREYDADQYAVALIALNLRALGADTSTTSGDAADEYVGYVDFFSLTYDLAGFEAEEAGKRCAYPSSAYRRQVAKTAFREVAASHHH